MEKIYMETSCFVVTKVLDGKLMSCNGIKLKEKDEFVIRKALSESNYEIKINERKFETLSNDIGCVNAFLSQYEIVDYFDYLFQGINEDEDKEYICFKDDDIFEYNGNRMGFVLGKYTTNNSPAISIVYVDDDNKDEGLYGTLSINLEEYGIINTSKQVAIHHDYMEYPQRRIVDKFIEMYGNISVETQYGFAQSIIVGINDFRKIPISPDMDYDDFE